MQFWQSLLQPIGLENRKQMRLFLEVNLGLENRRATQQFGVALFRSGRPPEIQQVMASGFGGKQSKSFYKASTMFRTERGAGGPGSCCPKWGTC
jgi:hypothetical protein